MFRNIRLRSKIEDVKTIFKKDGSSKGHVKFFLIAGKLETGLLLVG